MSSQFSGIYIVNWIFVSTALQNDSSLSVTSQDTVPVGITFNNDGTKMYIVGFAGKDINEYTLSTAFDVSTASYSQNFSVNAQETSPYSVVCLTDRTKMFVVGNNGDDVNEYSTVLADLTAQLMHCHLRLFKTHQLLYYMAHNC